MVDEVDIYGDLLSELPSNLAPAPESPPASSLETKPILTVASSLAGRIDAYREPEDDDTESSSEEGDGPDVLFEEVTASKTQLDATTARRRRAGPRGLHRLEPTVFHGPPPHVALHADMASNYVAVSGLDWWLSDAKLRQKAEQVAPCRHVRILERTDNGKSLGIGIFEFASSEGAEKALRTLPEVLRIGTVRSMPISAEFLIEARRPSHVGPSWLEGGPISQELLPQMHALFGTNLYVKPIPKRPLVRVGSFQGSFQGQDMEPLRQGSLDINLPLSGYPGLVSQPAHTGPACHVSQVASTGLQSLTPLPKADIWASKLQQLKLNVNRKAASPEHGEQPDAKRRR